MGFMDKVKATAEKAAEKAQTGGATTNGTPRSKQRSRDGWIAYLDQRRQHLEDLLRKHGIRYRPTENGYGYTRLIDIPDLPTDHPLHGLEMALAVDFHIGEGSGSPGRFPKIASTGPGTVSQEWCPQTCWPDVTLRNLPQVLAESLDAWITAAEYRLTTHPAVPDDHGLSCLSCSLPVTHPSHVLRQEAVLA